MGEDSRMHVKLTCKHTGTKFLVPIGMLYVEACGDIVRAAALGLPGTFQRAGDVGLAEPRMVDVAEPLWEIEAMLDKAKGVLAGAST